MRPFSPILLIVAAAVLLAVTGPAPAQNAATSTFNHFSTGFPLTGTHVVNRVITDLAVLDVTPSGFEVVELATGVTRQQIEQQTEAPLLFNETIIQR